MAQKGYIFDFAQVAVISRQQSWIFMLPNHHTVAPWFVRVPAFVVSLVGTMVTQFGDRLHWQQYVRKLSSKCYC
jgi:hypothetical protein